MAPLIIAAWLFQAGGGEAAQAARIIQPDVEGRDVTAAPVPPRRPPAIAQPPEALGPVNARTGRPYKGGLWKDDYVYTLAPGVVAKEVVWWSEGTPCYAKIFYPKGFDAARKVAAVVLGQGWAGTHYSIEKYGARFAERGLVAMVIDYRGWGSSDGVPRLLRPLRVGGSSRRDVEAKTQVVSAPMEIVRTKLSAVDQQRDLRNAISYIQGEPGVDAERIGLWGSSYAGGNALAVAGQDLRVKAVSVQIPAFIGPPTFQPMRAPPGGLADAIARARTGRGGETATGYSRVVSVDLDQGDPPNQHAWAMLIRRPVQVVMAQNEELSGAASVMIPGLQPLKDKGVAVNFVTVPTVTHFEMYVDAYVDAQGRTQRSDAFQISANSAADWFVSHLNAPEALAPPVEPVR